VVGLQANTDALSFQDIGAMSVEDQPGSSTCPGPPGSSSKGSDRSSSDSSRTSLESSGFVATAGTNEAILPVDDLAQFEFHDVRPNFPTGHVDTEHHVILIHRLSRIHLSLAQLRQPLARRSPTATLRQQG